MKNYLILTFKNAGWFPNNRGNDRIIDMRGNSARNGSKQYVEPISSNHISNMLHVLLGERPKPSLRKTTSFLKEIDDIVNITKNGWLKINKYTYGNKENLIDETIQTNSSFYNSTNKQEILYWDKIKTFLKDKPELYDEFIQILNTLFSVENITEKYSFDKCMDILYKKHKNNNILKAFVGKLKKNNKASLVYVINKEQKTNFNAQRNTLQTVPRSVDKIVRLSGEIIVPIENDFWYKKLCNGRGFAKLLDGGLVLIKEVRSAEEWGDDKQLSGFRKISELSNELK